MAMFASVLWCQYHCLSSNFSMDIFSLWRWTWLPFFFFSSSGYFESIFATFNIILIVMHLKYSHVFFIYIFAASYCTWSFCITQTHIHITQSKWRTKEFCALTGSRVSFTIRFCLRRLVLTLTHSVRSIDSRCWCCSFSKLCNKSNCCAMLYAILYIKLVQQWKLRSTRNIRR